MESGIALLLPLLLLLLGWGTGGRGGSRDCCEATIPSQSWRPIVPTQLSSTVLHRIPGQKYRFGLQEEDIAEVSVKQSQLLGQDANRDQCSLYKVVMTQQLYFEYIHYKINLPDLKEFTLCMWKKFTNHTNNHPLFSYAVGDQPRSILSWIANTQRSSYYMLNVDGHNLYRLNYPLRLNKWYHSCQSWNGRTGEWQIWVNDERVGRGFNNRLVGHVIKGGGIAISGQEQQQLGGGFLEGEGAPAGSGGMLGELTMVQLYGVALTAGKAHRDHKHHHAHHFEHDTNSNMPPSTTTQTPITVLPLQMHPLLTGGQLNHQVKINPGAHIQIVQNGVTLRHPNLPAPSVAPQPLPPVILPAQSTIEPGTALQPNLPFEFAKTLEGIGSPRFPSTSLDNSPINGFSFVDRRYRNVLSGNLKSINDRRDKQLEQQPHDEEGSEEVHKMIEGIEFKKIAKRESRSKDTKEAKMKLLLNEDNPIKIRDSGHTTFASTGKKKKQKRGFAFADGSVIDDSYIEQTHLQLLTDWSGLTSFGLNPAIQSKIEDKKNEREPAEDEVRRVMNICDGCTDEPFAKALVMSWRNVPKKLYSGALHVPAIQTCKAF